MADRNEVLKWLGTGVRMLPNHTVTTTAQLIKDVSGLIVLSELTEQDLVFLDQALPLQVEGDGIVLDRTGHKDTAHSYDHPFTVKLP